jgi:mono/diheme cytochrome c family protein
MMGRKKLRYFGFGVASCLGWLIWVSAGATGQVAAQGGDDQTAYEKQIYPLFAKYCIGCHGGKKPKADLSLESFRKPDELVKNGELLEELLNNVKNGEMPPPGKAKPSKAEAAASTTTRSGT